MGTEEDWMIGRLEDWQRQRKRRGIEAWERRDGNGEQKLVIRN